MTDLAQCLLQKRQMVRSLGEDQHFSALPVGGQYIFGNESIACCIVGENAEHILDW